MILYHETTNQHGRLFVCAMINDLVYVPFSPDKEYVHKRAKSIEKGLKDGSFDIKRETFKIT